MRWYSSGYSISVNDEFLVFNGCFHKYWVIYKVGPVIFFLKVKIISRTKVHHNNYVSPGQNVPITLSEEVTKQDVRYPRLFKVYITQIMHKAKVWQRISQVLWVLGLLACLFPAFSLTILSNFSKINMYWSYKKKMLFFYSLL